VHWVREVKQERAIRSPGKMPQELLEAIVRAFDRIQANDDVDDWV
jgi:hypothetical protein